MQLLFICLFNYLLFIHIYIHTFIFIYFFFDGDDDDNELLILKYHYLPCGITTCLAFIILMQSYIMPFYEDLIWFLE